MKHHGTEQNPYETQTCDQYGKIKPQYAVIPVIAVLGNIMLVLFMYGYFN